MNDNLQSLQYIVYFVILLVGIGIQWGFLQAFKQNIEKEFESHKKDMSREIEELKRRTDKIHELTASQAAMLATLNSISAQITSSFSVINEKLKTYDQNIIEFYKDKKKDSHP